MLQKVLSPTALQSYSSVQGKANIRLTRTMDFIVCISKVLSLAVIRAILSQFYPENYCSPWPIGSKQQKLATSVSFIGSKQQKLATSDIKDDDVAKWKKVEMVLEAYGSDANSILQLTTSKRSTIWLDQVSALPLDTHNDSATREREFGVFSWKAARLWKRQTDECI
ncbi:uncharacterized protein LOC131016504 isoform X2 [Salvia miltiorrhiza]|uniref:uncharacterized protein LOC131016504 isoform X2 n=1 Tax=Salvia miltiorrhiza TaxID=226208 RepID=UPI0025AC613B|nr:uncharacterized protein LOC131016504 isoform X2 [Salvia miltiorrhiza]